MNYFRVSEFCCPCCGLVEMDQAFLEMLDEARGKAGVPFIITSGYRCEKHNAEVGGVPGSAHREGLAADISCTDNRTRFKMIEGLIQAGFNRIGIRKDFIHADYSTNQARPTNRIWLY